MHYRKNIKLHKAEQAKPVYQYKNTKTKLYKNNTDLVQQNMQSKADNTNLCQHKNERYKLKMSRVRSQAVYCADDYRERRYQMLCEYNFSS